MEGPSSASLKLMLAGLVGCEGEATLLTFFPAPRLSGSDLLPHEMTAAALGSEALQRSACWAPQSQSHEYEEVWVAAVDWAAVNDAEAGITRWHCYFHSQKLALLQGRCELSPNILHCWGFKEDGSSKSTTGCQSARCALHIVPALLLGSGLIPQEEALGYWKCRVACMLGTLCSCSYPYGMSLLAGLLPSDQQCWHLLSHGNVEIAFVWKAEGWVKSLGQRVNLLPASRVQCVTCLGWVTAENCFTLEKVRCEVLIISHARSWFISRMHI